MVVLGGLVVVVLCLLGFGGHLVDNDVVLGCGLREMMCEKAVPFCSIRTKPHYTTKRD